MDNLSVTLRRIVELKDEKYDTEDGEVAPTPETFVSAEDMLSHASEFMLARFPVGYASTTGRGDIRVYWENGVRRVHLMVENGTRVSLYHREGEHSELATNASADDLAERLTWLLHP